MRLKIYVLLVFPLCLFACKETQKSTPAENEDGKYNWSVKWFFKDQWNTRRDNPVALIRLITLNGQTDSSIVPLDSTLWFGLTAKFNEADINDSMYVDKYTRDYFVDDKTGLEHYFFQAKEPQLFMQKMDIAADAFTHLIHSLYIETKEQKRDYYRTEKLQYIPDRIFQIQEYEKSSVSPEKNLKMEYKYFTAPPENESADTAKL